jgi:hypothetical protein
MRFQKTVNSSNFAGGPDDPYTTYYSGTTKIASGGFLLRPAIDVYAFMVLKNYYELLPVDDERKTELSKTIERLSKLWDNTNECI